MRAAVTRPVPRFIARQPVSMPEVPTRTLLQLERMLPWHMVPRTRARWLARGIAARYGEEI